MKGWKELCIQNGFFGTILQEIKILLIPLLIVLLFKDFIISVVMKKITILSFLKREVKTILKEGVGLFFCILIYELFGKFILGIFVLIWYLIILLLSYFYKGSAEDKIDGINLMIVIFGAWIMIMYIM